MAASIKTIDTDIITLRQINVRSATNGFIPGSNVLVSNGAGVGYWNLRELYSAYTFYAVSDANGSTMSGNQIGPTLPISTVGVQGLFSAYVDFASSTFTLSNAYPNLLVALNTVPTVTRQARPDCSQLGKYFHVERPIYTEIHRRGRHPTLYSD
jgi:hypothetical protein